MIRLSETRKALFTGAASLCVAIPAVLSTPFCASSALRADDTTAVRNPNHLLQAAVERELSGLGIEAGAPPSGVELTAGESMQPIQPTGTGQPGGAFGQHYQSEVQRQLQMLYQQNGRPMPNMVPTPQVTPEAWEQYQQQHGALPTDGRRPSRWDWLKPRNWGRQWRRTFGRSNQSVPQPPEPPEFDPDGAEVLPQVPSNATATHPQPAIRPQDTAPQMRLQPSRTPQSAAPAAQAEASQPRLFPGLLEEMQPPAQEQAAQPPTLILMPAKPDDELTEPVAAPPVDGLPFADGNSGRPEPQLDSRLTRERLPILDAPGGDRAQNAQPQSDSLLNPFPDLAEQEADEQSPYSGLQLEDDPFADPVPAPANPPVADNENPFAPFVERHAGASVTVQPQLPPVADEVGPSLEGPGLPVEPGTLPNIEPRQLAPAMTADGAPTRSREVQEKMARIASRRGLTGLKGFCPVVLRDYRELEDARAEFTVIYEGKQYWFSSEDAKQVFLLSPEVYAPVKGGIDLVHFQKTGEEREGMLDYAAWFHGRLHLFSSAENKAAFVASPQDYAIDE